MKNETLNLKQELPPILRLSIYRQAKQYLTALLQEGKNDIHNDINSPYYNKHWIYNLCLLFPCILWDLHSYLDTAPFGHNWNFLDTPTAFPELKRKLPFPKHRTYHERIQFRIDILSSFELELKDKLKLN